MRLSGHLAAVLVVALLAGILPSLAVARAIDPGAGTWLETAPIANWNTPAAAVPAAPTDEFNPGPGCGGQERPAESPEEDQVVAAGWRLFNAAEVGWGLRLVDALVGYDGMCRPLGFNAFVFADGQFAGTIAPDVMNSRTDGVGRIVNVSGPANLTGQFVRYASTDPLCCPSSTFTVTYAVDRTPADGPVLVPLKSTRNP